MRGTTRHPRKTRLRSLAIAAAAIGAALACGLPAAEAHPDAGTLPAAETNPDAGTLSAASDRAASESGAVRNVILLIGDGVGAAYWTAARWAGGALAVERMPVVGLTDTRSADAYITDSGAAATALAAGRRTYNTAIGVGPECRELLAADSAAVMRDPAACDPLETVFDLAWEAGMGAGLVATSTITHATPAPFAAKVPHRRMHEEIARQLAERPVDVLLGGGRRYFDGSHREDGRDLLAELCSEAVCLFTPAELLAYRADDRRLVGLFASGNLPPAGPREPTLPAMTRAALDRLSREPAGFVLMVEGSQPDFVGHANEPLAKVTAEMRDFDEAVKVALDFAEETAGTLVLVVSDHETGGLALVSEGDSLVAEWATTRHTGEMTPHFAAGAGAERFSGILDIDEIGRRLMELVRSRGEPSGP